MPFTFAHPAIVLPLTWLSKRWYSLTGLVIGSVTPDFEYFIRMKVQSTYSHTWPGLVYFDLPVGLLLCFIFHGIVRNSLFENLPAVLKKHLMMFTSFNWLGDFKRRWLVVVVSLLVGSASHILWDGFTHSSGYFVQIFPVLTNHISIASLSIPIYKIIQHCSSVVGMCLVAFSITTLPVTQVNRKIDYKYWLWAASITVTITALRLLIADSDRSYGNALVTIISGILLSVILTPLILKSHSNKYINQ